MNNQSKSGADKAPKERFSVADRFLLENAIIEIGAEAEVLSLLITHPGISDSNPSETDRCHACMALCMLSTRLTDHAANLRRSFFGSEGVSS